MPIPAGPLIVDGDYRPLTTTAGDVSVELDGWAAPAFDDYGTLWCVENMTGWNGTPDVRTAGQDRQADHGSFDAPAFYGSRVITIDGWSQSDSREANMRAQDIMASVGGQDLTGLLPLVVTEPGRPIRRCMVRLNAPTKVDPRYGGLAFDWSLQLKAPDPFRYADAETLVTLTLPSGADAGLSLPFTVPFIIPMSGVGENRATVVNAGTFATRPTVVFQGPVTDPAIVNLTQGKTLAFNVTITSGQTLVVDFANRSVLLDGTVSRAYTIAYGSAWWDLQPGSNDVQYAGVGSGTALLTYRSSWL